MARKIIDIGTVGNDGTGDSIRDSFRKVNDNFRELYSSLGLGERLLFIEMDDTPPSYVGQNDPLTGSTPILTINETESGLSFKHLRPGLGVSLDFTDPSEITINSEFSEISADPSPQLGGDLSARSGGNQYRIIDLGTESNPLDPIFKHEAVNKNYADTKLSLAGANAIDPAINDTNTAFGFMTGPLILSRDPVPDDDEVYEGRIAATKNYVDGAGFSSRVNLYVATSGEDDRVGVGRDRQGRALSYAYRSLEAALKRAEELINESRKEIGPYKKVLTYDGGTKFCTLEGITVAPSSGGGFSGQVLMSIDTITLNSPGSAYAVGDLVSITTGTFSQAATVEVLSVNAGPGTARGPILTFRLRTSGVYSALPGATSVPSTSTSEFGSGATFDLTYKVNNAIVLDRGSGYGLVSLRIEGGGGSGAFGTAEVVGGEINSLTITDGGSGFTSLPNVIVNLPRFLLKTEGLRTDFTGDVENDTAQAIRGRDIREGLYLRGETSDALAQILAHSGELDSDGDEIFDVDIIFGAFQVGERISYGDVTVNTQISILVESGIYEENFPLKVPQNVAIIGDEFRRVLVRPKKGISSSPWAFQKFRRDTVMDGLNTATQLYGHHYLTDSTQPVYPPVSNKGFYNAAASLLDLNRSFLQQQVVNWIDDQIENNIPPFTSSFEYNRDLCQRDLGLIIDALIFDLRYGGSNRTISSALKYYGPPTSLGDPSIAIGIGPGGQLSQTVAAIERLNVLAQLVIKNIEIQELYEPAVLPQIIDRAFIAESGTVGTNYNISAITNANPINISTSSPHTLNTGDRIVIGEVNGMTEINGNDYYVTVLSPTVIALHELEDLSDQVDSTNFGVYTSGGVISEPNGVVGNLLSAHIDIVSDPDSFNSPKNNDEMDVFLCNDAVILRAMTIQGHGGFSMVLDPTGQILAKSPYAQECASFSRSINAQIFAGGMFVDGFTGNLEFKHTASDGPFRLSVSNLDRIPNVPCSFLVNDVVHRVNYVRDFTYNALGSTATLVLDETTPFTQLPGSQTVTISVADPAVFTRTNHELQVGSILTFSSTGTLPTGIIADKEYYVIATGLTASEFQVSDDPQGNIGIETTGAGSGVHSYQRTYELLMPGNRSMLSNDFTQICDLGYGIMVTNGGLTEAVSMFTYYCHISYYALNGGQIRSVAGSSAHGNYALVAEGSDPLEIPTPVSIYNEWSQRVDCYAPTPSFENDQGGLFIFVTNYKYEPLGSSELEIDHGNIIFRYPVTSVTVGTNELPVGVARLNLTSDTTGNFDGLFAQVADGEKMTLRANGAVVLTGDIVDVATRPSTGLVLNESPDVYRVLQFDDYTDPNGPYEVDIATGDPGEFTVLLTVTDIDTNVCTTDGNHLLDVGDKFIPTSTANGFNNGTTYYIIDVPNYNQFTVSTTPGGGVQTLTNGTGLSIKGVKTHKLLANYLMSFETTGTLPGGLTGGDRYFVSNSGLTDVGFRLSEIKNGEPIEITGAGSGIHSYVPEGLGLTILRENYDYIDLTLFQPGDLVSGTTNCTITIAAPAVITAVGHGLSAGDVIRFITSGNLPSGLTAGRNYFVISAGLGLDDFRVSVTPGGTAVDTFGTQSGTQAFGLVTGRAGDSDFAVVPVAPEEKARLNGSKFVFLGEEYTITTYDDESATGDVFGRVNLNRPLEDSIIQYGSSYTVKSAVPIRSIGANGTLTIRISLTRVTGHDLLDIGTGSYADTNYPNEIYGAPVNAYDESLETEERDVGRVFYVTTDQFGNFRVGPYFAVDQGTGRVTFSAAIALSNLDGIGFKRGVPIAEFSVDSGFTDNAIDTVPTENATRIYIERRLGITHSGAIVTNPLQLIPPDTGGFMPLGIGGVAMRVDMNLGNNKIVSLSDPADPQDAVNLRSLTFDNFQDFTATDVKASDILLFTGAQNQTINASVVGDINFGIDSTLGTVDAQIQPGVIINSDINATAGIVQSKLSMTLSSASASAPTGTAAAKQAASGLSSFDSAIFTVTDGWVTIKDNGLALNDLPQIGADTVLGNSTAVTANVTAVTFATVVNEGLAVKKSNYTALGYLRRKNTLTPNGDTGVAPTDSYEMIDHSSLNAASTLVFRDSNGDFGARNISAERFLIDTKILADTAVSGGGGVVQLHGYLNQAAILLGDGSLSTDKRNYYDNEGHIFRPQNGVGFAPITCSQITATALTTGGSGTAGTVTGNWSLSAGSRLQATYADLAEYYESDQEYEKGTVLVFGGDKEVTTTGKKADTRVAGIVSENAAYVMNSDCPGVKVCIALQGRVPCKVVGKISKGDLLVTAGIHGVAISSTNKAEAGTIVGKALENYDSDHIGIIEVAIGRT